MERIVWSPCRHYVVVVVLLLPAVLLLLSPASVPIVVWIDVKIVEAFIRKLHIVKIGVYQ